MKPLFTVAVASTALWLDSSVSADPAKGPEKSTSPAEQRSEPRKRQKKHPTADRLLARIKSYYASLKDYQADFIQTYTKVALSQTTESRGTLQIKKPGFMRWSYSKPAEKVWIVDGDTLYVADPEFEQVYVHRKFKTAELKRSISFLWGRGRLDDAFAARLGNPQEERLPEGFSLLVLRPLRGATYAKLTLIVNSHTGEVVASTIHETAGNTNRFRFMNPKLNQRLPRALFRFETPKGWAVIEQ